MSLRSLVSSCAAVLAVLLFPSASRALTVGPAILDASLEAGSATTVQIVVGNNAAMYQTFDLSTEAFESVGEKGQSMFLGKTGAAQWLITDASVTLQPGENHRLPVSIRVPEGTTPGSYQVALFVTERAGAETGVSNLQRLGVLFFVTVKGDTKVEWKNPSFSAIFPAVASFGNAFDVRIENQGNSFGSPSGTIEISSVFGVTKILALNPQEVRVLPKSARAYTIGFGDTRTPTSIGDRLKQEWSGLAIGPYKATMKLDGYPTTLQTSFTVIPTATLAIAFFVLFAVVLVAWWGRRVRRTV